MSREHYERTKKILLDETRAQLILMRDFGKYVANDDINKASICLIQLREGRIKALSETWSKMALDLFEKGE